MTAPTVPTAPLDLTKYEGHTPGPWEMYTSNSFRRIGQQHGKDGGVLYATKHADGVCDLVFSNGGFEGPDAQLMVDAPQLLAALLTMQRERDEAQRQTKVAIEVGAKHVYGLQAERDAAREQLAASERTCAELRGHIQLHGGDTISLSNELDEWKARAEAAERTVEGLRGKP